jgi:hypothetical protein
MKLRLNIRVRAAGIMLLECVVYIAVLMVILGLGGTAFYLCWDNRDLRRNTDDITHRTPANAGAPTSATRPGESPSRPIRRPAVRIPSARTKGLRLHWFGRRVAVRRPMDHDTAQGQILAHGSDRRTHAGVALEVELVPVRARTGLHPLFLI